MHAQLHHRPCRRRRACSQSLCPRLGPRSRSPSRVRTIAETHLISHRLHLHHHLGASPRGRACVPSMPAASHHPSPHACMQQSRPYPCAHAHCRWYGATAATATAAAATTAAAAAATSSADARCRRMGEENYRAAPLIMIKRCGSRIIFICV